MSSSMFDKGRQGFADDTVNGSTGTFKSRPITRSVTSNNNKAITGATNATPIVITVASTTGWANGDKVVIVGVAGNTAANGTWIVAGLTGTTVNLTTVPAPGGTALNSTGNGAYTSGGTIFNLSQTYASTDMPAVASGGADVTLTSVSTTTPGLGVFTSANPSYTVNASTTVDAFVLFQSAATDRAVHYYDGKQLVRAAATAALSATTIVVEPLYAGIPNGTALIFSNGVTATLTALAAAGDRSLTVSALSAAIAAGHHTDAPITSANLPLTTGSPGTQTITVTVDSVNGWFKL